MHFNSIILPLKNDYLKCIFFLLLFVFFGISVHAQKASATENLAAYGYSKRFLDTASCKKMQQLALDQAKRVKIVQEDRLMLEFDKELTKGFENAKVQITTPELYEKTIYSGYTEAGETKEASFKVKVNQKEPVKGKLKLMSTRGGYLEREFTLGN